MSPRPLISVLFPVRNGEAVARKALDSIVRQTFADFEVVAVDDGSTDRTMEVLQSLAAEDPRVRVFNTEPKGIVAALELARSQARGRYLARMDADDGAFANRFQMQLDVMRSDRRIVLCGGGVAYFPREKVRDGALRYESWINGLVSHEDLVRDLFVECPIPHPSFMMRADVLDLLGGYRAMGWPEDYDLVLRMWEGGGRFEKVPDVLIRWRESEDRLSRTHEDYSPAAFRRCKVHFLLRTLLRGGQRVVVWGAGPVGKAFARELSAQGGILAAFVDLDPRKVGQRVQGVRVLTPEQALSLKGVFSVSAVAKGNGREEIRRALTEAGRIEMEEFVAVA
ncbi:MAG: glycosyltransferase [Gemmatimonadetes bacterium]|nr:glycosyltransferase [Gemmatimonadota bacterium]